MQETLNQAVGLTRGLARLLPGPAKRGKAKVITFALSFQAGCESENFSAIYLFSRCF